MDRRAGKRFDLNVQVQFVWTIPGTNPQSAEGRTRNASLRGLFVIADACPPVGSALRLNFVLPSTAGGSALLMRARATVVRVEAIDGAGPKIGFAATTKRYALERTQGCSIRDVSS
jgi:hypothetical protein